MSDLQIVSLIVGALLLCQWVLSWRLDQFAKRIRQLDIQIGTLEAKVRVIEKRNA